MSELLCVAVPGGRLDATSGLLRILLTPRLSSPEHLLDWPATLAGATVELQLATAAGTALPHTSVAVDASSASSEVWHRFFDQITVQPWGGVPSYGSVTATDTTANAEQTSTLYSAAVDSIGDPATVESGLAALDLDPPPPPPDPTAAVPSWTPPDFHRALALLRSFPAVLRALGLVVEVEVPRSLIDQAGKGGTVRAVWQGAPEGYDVSAPATAFEVVDGFFVPLRTATIVGGFVDLAATSEGPTGDPVRDWSVVTFDIDAATSALTNAQGAVAARRSRSLSRGGRADQPLVGQDVELPGRRSMGLQIVHRSRQTHLGDRSARGRARAGQALGEAAPLTADDLVLGYRLDVREPAGRWFSTMRRSAQYTVGGTPIPAPAVEEGHVAASAVVRGTDGELRTDGVVVRWDGSRLGVPARRPGAAAPVQAAPPADLMPYDFRWSHDVAPDEPAGWRALRFSYGYQMRLRVADIAGGGLEVGDVTSGLRGTEDVTYLRHEPVLPPELPTPAGLVTPVEGSGGDFAIDHALLGPGGALDRLVIRSDPAGSSPLPAYPANDSRVLLPPAATFEVSDWEGRLDGDGIEAWRLARRALAPPRASAEVRNGRQYTWLPDPAADQLAVAVVPVATPQRVIGPTRERWDLTPWPDYPGKTVVLVAGEGDAPTTDFGSVGTATVALPPGQRARVEVSSAVRSEYFARFDAITDAVPNSAAHTAVTTGRHPVVTPARTLEVVHAVRRPLAVPAATLQATRDSSTTVAVVADPAAPRFGVDHHSTVQIDVTASWQEVTDDGTDVVTTPVQVSLPALPVPVDGSAVGPIRHDLGDSRHRLVTYRLDARSRYREFFSADDPDEAFVSSATSAPVHLDSTARPPAPLVVSAHPAFGTVGGSDPNTRAAGLLRIELDGPWFVTGEGEQLGLVVPAAEGAAIERLDGTDAPPETAWSPLVTAVYADPIFPWVGQPRQVDSSSVAGAGGPPVIVTDVETGASLCVLPFDVTCVEGRRFADLDFGTLAEETDRPMVRPAVVRFQRHSLAGLTTSPVVRIDPVGLLPSRVQTVHVDSVAPMPLAGGEGVDGDTRVQVSLTGGGSIGEVEVRVEAARGGVAPDGLALATTPAELVDSSGVWQVVARGTAYADAPVAGASFYRLPGTSYRVVVTEWDRIPASTGTPPTPPDSPAAGFTRRPVFVAVEDITWQVSTLPSQ